LEFGIEDVDGTAKYVGTFKIGVISARARPELVRRQSAKRFPRDAVVDPYRIVHGQSPEVELASRGPMKHKMKEIGSGHA
jgi:hypothetical protein